jgi:hypothetical protein
VRAPATGRGFGHVAKCVSGWGGHCNIPTGRCKSACAVRHTGQGPWIHGRPAARHAQVDFKPTGRLCAAPGCGGALADNILDWDSPLPEDELQASEEAAKEAVSRAAAGRPRDDDDDDDDDGRRRRPKRVPSLCGQLLAVPIQYTSAWCCCAPAQQPLTICHPATRLAALPTYLPAGRPAALQDVALSLGTSLQITPANGIPGLVRRKGVPCSWMGTRMQHVCVHATLFHLSCASTSSTACTWSWRGRPCS